MHIRTYGPSHFPTDSEPNHVLADGLTNHYGSITAANFYSDLCWWSRSGRLYRTRCQFDMPRGFCRINLYWALRQLSANICPHPSTDVYSNYFTNRFPDTVTDVIPDTVALFHTLVRTIFVSNTDPNEQSFACTNMCVRT